MPRVRDPSRLALGVFLIAVGVAGLQFGSHLAIGTLLRMGPGYFPRVLSWLLVGFGVVISLVAFRLDGPPLQRWAWRPLLILLGALTVFGLAIDRLGMVITAMLTVLIATFAAPDRRWGEAALFAVVLAAGCALLFTVLLGIPVPVWPR